MLPNGSGVNVWFHAVPQFALCALARSSSAFGGMMLREMTSLVLQRFLSRLASTSLTDESQDKIRDVLSAVLGFAKQHGPAQKTGRKRSKPYLTPEQFEILAARIPEPYATMVYVAIFTGLRVSELAGLRWNDLGGGHDHD